MSKTNYKSLQEGFTMDPVERRDEQEGRLFLQFREKDQHFQSSSG